MPSDDVAPSASIRKPVSLWKNRDYMILWSGQSVSTLGSGVSQLAYPLLALALTHSPAQAGLVGAMFGLPFVLFSLPAGAYVDRWDRKRVMMICDGIRALNAGSIPVAAALGVLGMGQLYGTSLVEGTCFVFFNVAETAALPRVVEKSQIPAASSQNQASQAAGALISPPLGGLIFQSLGRTVPFLLDSVSYAVSVASLFLIRTQFQLDRTAPRRSLSTEIMEGLRWLWGQPLIRYMGLLTGGLNFVTSGTFLIILIIAKHQGASPSLIGVMFAIGAVGGLLGAMVAPSIQKRFGFTQVIVTTVWIQALSIPLFAVAPNVVILGVLGGISFAVSPIYNAVQFSYRMAIIPDALQGRVNSAMRLAIFGTMPVGSVLAGVLIQGFGAVTSVLVFGGVIVTLATITSLNPQVRSARPNEEVYAS